MKTQDYLSELTATTEKYDVAISGVLVTDIMEWCKNHGVEESNPFRLAKTIRCNETGEYLILLAEEIDEAHVRKSVLPGIQHPRVGELEDMEVFLRHLVLHEVAHATNENWSEGECDSWAFEQLDQI